MQADSAARKATPIFSGCLRYFPNALTAVARLSKLGNDKHNPGEPLHWSREKSSDHGDCIVRHQLDFDTVDPETGEYHAVAVAWRALAQLELLEEAKNNDPKKTPSKFILRSLAGYFSAPGEGHTAFFDKAYHWSEEEIKDYGFEHCAREPAS